jgi:arginine-tRNA-protein transferase
VPVERFAPDKSQRRCLRLNQDLNVAQAAPDLTDEKLELYSRYVRDWHGRANESDSDRESLRNFLYESPVNTHEFCYRTAAGKLVAVGIADISSQAFSSVYFYFDPDEHRRGLGTFGALHELQFCCNAGIPYYYLGFWVEACEAMRYKARFRPCQILDQSSVWRDL